MTGPSSDLRARVLGAAHKAPSRTRSALVKQRALAASIALVWLGIVASFGHARPDAAGVALLAVWMMGAILTSAYALFTPKSSLGRPRIVLASMGPIIGALVLAAAWVGGTMFGHADDHHNGFGVCWALTIAVAVVPLGLGLWVERASDPIGPSASGAAIGALAGAWAGVAMSFVCGRSEPVHVLAGHVFSFLVVVAVAAVVGRRVLMLR